MSSQLPLPFVHRPDYARAAFLPAPSNEAALAWLGRAAEWPGGRLALWGQAGCGKTHLLHIWAARAGAAVLRGDALPHAPPDGPVAVDEAERALGWEPALLHLLNAAAEAGHPLLLAARLPPARWSAVLPDLSSRLRAITAVEIRQAEDELLSALFARLLSDRQLAVAPAIQSWMLARLPRTPAALRHAAALLDGAALASGRAVTRGIAASVVEAMAGEG